MPFPHSEEILRSILEHASIGMSLVDADGKVVYANQSFSKMFGYPIADCIGLRVRDLVDAAMAGQAAGQVRQLIDGAIDSYRSERRYRRSDGTCFWGLVSASAVRNARTGGPLYLIVQIADIDREKQAEVALAEAEGRWSFALDSARQGVWDIDLRTGRAFYSPMWRTMRGYGPDEFVDSSQSVWLARVHPDDRERIREQVRRQDSGELSYNEFEYRERHRDGHWIWILSRGKPIELNPDGSVARIIGTDTDITRMKAVENQLAAEKERLAVTLDSIAEGVISTGPDRTVVMINAVARQLTGWAETEAIGRPVEEVFAVIGEADRQTAIQPVLDALDGKTARLLREGSVLRSRTGEPRFIRESAATIRKAEGAVAGGVIVFQDITESHLARRRLTYEATHDALTGLANRLEFERALDQALDQARTESRIHALCFLDLDQFKQVNDTAGHAAGDALLREVGALIRRCCRSHDVAARLGGDEFALLLYDCDTAEARRVAEKVARALEERPFIWGNQTFRVSASAGIAPIDASAGPVADVMAAADAACYADKRRVRP